MTHVTCGMCSSLNPEEIRDFKAFEKAYRENKNTTGEGGAKYSLNKKFNSQIDSWDRNTIGFSFVVGATSDALIKAGIPNQQIRWDASKIKTTIEKHNGMSLEVIKQVPHLLENPVVVIDSKTDAQAKIIMGELYDDNGKIVTAVLKLNPSSKKGNQLDLIKISSTQGRGHFESLFKYEDGKSVTVRYADKNRIQNWLNVNRLQLPLHSFNLDSKYSISNSSENVKQKQLEIIEKVNPAPNTYNTWIRKVEDIKTLAETLEDSDWAGGGEFDPDLTSEMIEEAIESGEITVYSSYPIEQGVFVSPSYMEAASYSGDGNVYEKTVSIDDVAWIDPTQGMYANVKENSKVQYSLSNNIEKVDEILYNKSSPLAINNRAKTNNNSSLKWVYDAEIFSVEESKLFHEKISEINTGRHSFGNNKNTLGEYMIPIGNKIIFTDGNYDSPYVREIVEVLTEYQTEVEDIRERIYNVEKGKSEKQDAARYVNLTYGKGCIVTYTSGISGVYGWENGRRKGRTRSSVIRNYLNKQFGTGNDRASRETPINEIAPIKEASSTDGVFSISPKTTTSQKYGDYKVSGEEVMLQKGNIKPTPMITVNTTKLISII